jgi:hypothetical protein
MSKLSLPAMRKYLSKSIPSLNRNKLNGILAEIDFRKYIIKLGYQERISPGGWVVRSVGDGEFGHHTSVFFPEIIEPDKEYPVGSFHEPPRALHTICATMHQIGIQSYYCIPIIETDNDPESIKWHATQLGIPSKAPYKLLSDSCDNFSRRLRRYNFLRYKTDTTEIPTSSVSDVFTKDNLRVSFANDFMSETSDIDGVFWGQQYTYPIEIKEKTSARDNKLGHYFGLDVGPFVKLAYYAAKKGNLHSIFIVREINNIEDRELVQWWFITYDTLAQYASWTPVGGGRNMMGGGSTVVKIPRVEFSPLTLENIDNL